MVHGKNRIPYRIDRRLSGLAGPDYDATISFGLPLEPEDSQYGKSRLGIIKWYYFLCRVLALPCTIRAQSARATVRALLGDGAATLA